MEQSYEEACVEFDTLCDKVEKDSCGDLRVSAHRIYDGTYLLEIEEVDEDDDQGHYGWEVVDTQRVASIAEANQYLREQYTG